MKQSLVANLAFRLGKDLKPQNTVRFLLEVAVEDCIDIAIGVLYLYTNKTGRGPKVASMTEVISAIGSTVRSKAKMKKDSGLAAKAGAFILYTFEEVGIIVVELGAAHNGHNTYLVNVKDEDKLADLWETITADKTEKLPSLIPYDSWTSAKHSTGVMLVKTFDKDVLKSLTPETHPIVFDVVNRAQKVGWRINKAIYDIYAWALRNKTDAFSDIWEMHNPEAKQSKLREAKAIGAISKRFLDETFYHLYTYDFRGRKYCSTAYLHEQGTDLAKGLLLRDECCEIGEQGFFWLCISIASNWAGDAGREDGVKTDKMPLKDRVYWVLDNEEIILSYAYNPKVNQGWMKGEKPWQLLAACFEYKNFVEWQQEIRHLPNFNELRYTYKSHLECFVDG